MPNDTPPVSAYATTIQQPPGDGHPAVVHGCRDDQRDSLYGHEYVCTPPESRQTPAAARGDLPKCDARGVSLCSKRHQPLNDASSPSRSPNRRLSRPCRHQSSGGDPTAPEALMTPQAWAAAFNVGAAHSRQPPQHPNRRPLPRLRGHARLTTSERQHSPRRTPPQTRAASLRPPHSCRPPGTARLPKFQAATTHPRHSRELSRILHEPKTIENSVFFGAVGKYRLFWHYT